MSTLNTFAEVIPLALIHGGIADHVRQEIELFAHGILQSYMVYADAYSLCADAFDMLTVHSPARPVAKIPALATVEDTNLGLDSYGTDLFTFAWLLLLNGKGGHLCFPLFPSTPSRLSFQDHLMAESNDRELLRILALYCLTFVITQLNAPSRRSIGDGL